MRKRGYGELEKLDYKKEYRDLYLPKKKPSIVQVPEMVFIMVDGRGNPNTGEEYQQAMEVLYGLSYGIKMSKMNGSQPEGYFEYVVPPLEGLWWVKDVEFDGKNVTDKEKFCWTSMIRQPEFVTESVFEWAKEMLGHKKPQLDLSKARLVKFTEGLCAQIMHVGPYDNEAASIEILETYIEMEGYVQELNELRRHHEIYLGDPRKTKPENLKTVIRHPVLRKDRGMKMITTRCGLSCEGCSYKEDCGCGECIKSNGNPFHGPCRLAQCCQDKGHVHCGECKEFPCELLKEYSYDQEQGDQGERIEVCRQWSSRRQDTSYPWIHEYLSEKPGTEMDFKVEWQWTRYKIGNKMFAAVCKDDSGNDYIISLKLEPSEGEFLRSQYEEIIPGYYMNKLHWNSVDLYGKVPENLLKDMIDKSYDLMLNSLSKKMQREILGKEN